MMEPSSELQDLYQQVILDHGRNPRNFHDNAEANHRADGFNPLCGDQVTIFCQVADERIDDVSFIGKGCAICTASASMMTQSLKHKSVAEARQLFEIFHQVVTGDTTSVDSLGKLTVFAGVRKYPMRVKCATLPWHTLIASLDQGGVVSTEEEA